MSRSSGHDGRAQTAIGEQMSESSAIEQTADAHPEPRDWREAVELRHHLAAAALVRALTTGDQKDWDAAAEVWGNRLGKVERLQLLGTAIRAADFNEALDLMDEAVRALSPMPGTQFGPLRDCAEQWVAWASAGEVKAYLLACFHKLPEIDQVRFLRALQKRVLG